MRAKSDGGAAGFGIVCFISWIFIVFKFFGIIDWPWWPLWCAAAVFGVVMIVAAVVAIRLESKVRR